jgi:Flp pilus assembly pilin Flp
MTPRRFPLRRLIRRLSPHWRDESGAALVEFAVVAVVFFLVFFALIDFGRIGFVNVMGNKATEMATRIAIVRPPVCAGVPEVHERGPAQGFIPPRFGTSCRAATGVCLNVAPVTCLGSDAAEGLGLATANEIFDRVRPLIPADATLANFRFTYSFDARLGFLGGPYNPVVTVDFQAPPFGFISPIGGLTALASPGTDIGDPIFTPSFSVSMPGEDLMHGTGG